MNDQELIQQARDAAGYASAPYSNFNVGAAVETDDGRIYRGCNIESPAYPLTLCAERVAIFATIAAGARPRRIAVSCLQGDPADPNSLTPCGSCRQVMMDQLGPNAQVLIDGVGQFSVEDLLPRGFRLPSG